MTAPSRPTAPPGGPGAPGGIDWQGARDRLDTGWARTMEALSPGGETGRRLLEERARRLAVRPPAPDTSPRIEALVVRLGGERWAVETRFVHRVIRAQEPTPVPGAPAWLLGLVDLRGEVLPVADIRGLLGLLGPPLPSSPPALVLGADAGAPGSPGPSVSPLALAPLALAPLALVVEETVGITSLRMEQVRSPGSVSPDTRRRWVLGVTDDATVVLDTPALLRDADLIVEART